MIESSSSFYSLFPQIPEKEREKKIEAILKDNRIFLHICCGPCAEWPVAILQKAKAELTGYFYNPNIHPLKEHERRMENVRKFAGIKDVPVIYDDAYMEEKWLHYKKNPEDLSRCDMCYTLRMDRAAKMAKENGYSFFTTSLLVSPYQKFDTIVRAGTMAGEKNGITFLPFDFRAGYRLGQQMAKEDGLYRQKFCGCILSLEESKYRDKILEQINIKEK